MTTGFTPDQRRAALLRNNGLCEVCGAALATDVHHRQPRGMGGAHRERAARVNALSNALALCRGCHSRVEGDRATATAHGWLVPRNESPAATPALLNVWLGHGPVLLGDDATYTPVPHENLNHDLHA